MFKRASASAARQDDVIDIRERLEPYGEIELSPEWRARYALEERAPQPSRTEPPHRPRHLARSTTD